MGIIKENAIIKQSFPQGGLISSRLSSQAVGNLLEVYDFMYSFKELIGLEEPILFEELEQELLCVSPYGVDKPSTLDKLEKFVHSVLLPELVRELLDIIASVINAKHVVEIELDMLPINKLTWPEVARRYIMAYLLMRGRPSFVKISDSNKSQLIHCLLSDCGIFYSSPTNAAGIDLDAQFLGSAVNNVFGKLRSVRNILSKDNMGDCSDGSIPQWAIALDPVYKLPTNVGSKIRKCVREALEKNPLDWAKEKLEDSISKDVYKGNASGPTKRAVIDVLNRVIAEASQRPLSFDVNVIMKKRRSVLREVAASYDNERDLFIPAGNNLEEEIKVVYGSVSRRPLDFPTVDLRLLHDTYCGSPQAFLEDVRELWANLKKSHANTSRMVKLVDDMSKDFTSKYENEVAPLLMRFAKYSVNEEFNGEVKKELEELLASIDIPKMSLEAGLCKVCSINQNDDKVLLCDTEWCNAEYHTYCLTPPLFEIPQDNWYCPACKKLMDDPPKCANILQLVENSGCAETKQLLDMLAALEKTDYWQLEAHKVVETKQLLDMLAALEKTEYWQLEAHKKIFLLKFLINMSVDTELIHDYLDKSKTKLANKCLGVDSHGRVYWGFPSLSTNSGIVVNVPKQPTNDGQWYLFQSEEDIGNLIGYLTVSDPHITELPDSILMWQETMSQSGQRSRIKSETVCSTSLNRFPSHNCHNPKAAGFLEPQYGFNRCDCLEPIFPSRYHCDKCHVTFFTNVEFKYHKNSTCEITLLGNTHPILRHLMINLLDMEAALPDEAKIHSMAGHEWRSGWCAFVKSATTIHEIVHATLALETMIKTEYVNNTWWWYWSSASVAENTPTFAALSFRIHTLDAAIRNPKTATISDDNSQKKRNNRQKKAKQKMKPEKPKNELKKTDVA
ncbi:methyl-CpG-binding domain-containing protein 9-like [Bidens hawaiensis]|uniref:methyl-CpG-binding domain-containing protein 9-like n=1 Tax=Bidens hawaiensis TaxID=980011 RepID=UPI00404B965F